MSLYQELGRLPDNNGKNVLVILSGGMDSTIAMALCCDRYGSEKVFSLSFDYGQKQKIELQKAKESSKILGVTHKICDLSVLNDISQGFSANVDTDIEMPTIQDVLGDPAPKTEVPNRNMILMSIAAAYAQVKDVEYIIAGLQVHDQYSYWDTTQKFVDSINSVLMQNRKTRIKIVAPFSMLSKKEEIHLLQELHGNIKLLEHTLTCYNPNQLGESCGICPSCSERIKNFAEAGFRDSIKYSISIPWEKIIKYDSV